MSRAKKICIVVTSLGKGGAERSSSLLTHMLSDLGHDIHLVSIMDDIDYEFKGQLLNLGTLQSTGPKLFLKYKKFKAFKSYLKRHQFDYVIDNRTRPSVLRELVVSRWLYNPDHTIYCVRSYHLNTYFVSSKMLAKYLYKDAYKIVGVSKEIAANIEQEFEFKNVTSIYNPIESIEAVAHKNERPYILFYGRIVDDVKNISLLIEAYQQSELPEQQIDLIILGSGEDVQVLKRKVNVLNLSDNIQFVPFQVYPYDYVKGAKFTVLTSHYEGFPRSIIESLALGIPVISVDCKSGPKEIIQHESNGLLVKNYNAKALAQAMNRFMNNQELYSICKTNAKSSVERFSMSAIARHWDALLK
ncbi:Glycosyltransferase involved in cell wall bisynthesis [Formosa sp. Hel1_31_208]|uniref:glycosyltransferase n=1 Tax=Formosa sp. Hel1_31_208 TaxID=1798225 RepID=UPI00087B3CE5|nr:glycosyltransferase [Formosa sp. Hel1_31_208]SDS03253.1 Glycosyltransferase involved in cell wall bisynthesis [Formosa sp. Hel1_31_208]